MDMTIADVVEALKRAKEAKQKCTLLIGAGCSVTAGIPLAKGFVDIIAERYPRAYDHATEKTYPYCMSSLSPGERYELVAEYVDKAKLNWAHIAIAQLMACGYVDRVLTTNFDPLLQRACALLNIYPAIYDFAASPRFVRNFVPDHAIFHLHGQRTGFVQLHSEEELAKHFEAIAPVFEDAVSRGLWIIVGYSGENDPVFTRLAEVPTFNDLVSSGSVTRTSRHRPTFRAICL